MSETANVQTTPVLLSFFTQLNDAISYVIVPRTTLDEPELPSDILKLKSNDYQRFKALQREYEYKHYEYLCTLFDIRDGIRLYTIGSKASQQNNDYARYFNGRIQDVPVNFKTHLLILRVDPTLLPDDFRIPIANESVMTASMHV